MVVSSRRTGLFKLLSVCFYLPVFAPAQEPAPSDATDERVRRLEAQFAASARRLEEVQRRAGLAAADSVEQDRTDAIKQQIREVLSEREFRESLMPAVTTAGYKDGFYIRSSDDLFSMRINGRMQIRWTDYATRSRNRYLLPRTERDDRVGFDLQRVRVAFAGNTFSKDLTYLLELRADAPEQNRFAIEYAYANYRFRDEIQVRAGVFRLASTRAQTTSDGSQQSIDRPMEDAVFGLGIGTGFRLWGQLFNKRLDYFLDVANALNSQTNRTITPDPPELDNNPAILFRLVWHALGDDAAKDFAGLPDIPRHATPALDFAFHYAFNDDQGDLGTTRIPVPLPKQRGIGGFGLTTTNGLQINQFGWDAVFKYQGLSVSGEYIVRIVDPRRAGGNRPFTPWWLVTGDSSTTAQQGAYVQAGYFLPIPGFEDKLELVTRIGGVSALADAQEGTWDYSGGVNYYMHGHKAKLQMECTKVSEAPISSGSAGLANVNDDALLFRVQLQVGF